MDQNFLTEGHVDIPGRNPSITTHFEGVLVTKYMSGHEFVEVGYLQELNRRFLHPLGLALEVIVDDDGTSRIGGIWDYRDDSLGIVFSEGVIDLDKAARVAEARTARRSARTKALGFWVQPVLGR